MNAVKVGKLIDESAQRDAIHVAIAPVVAGQNLSPGESVGMAKDGTVIGGAPAVGVIDPFLERPVKKGERCYLFLRPETVTSLRHHWTHPDFDHPRTVGGQVITSASEIWLRAYAMRTKPHEEPNEAYKNLLDDLRNNRLFYHGQDLYERSGILDEYDLCEHCEKVLGFRPNFDHFSFSCSC